MAPYITNKKRKKNQCDAGVLGKIEFSIAIIRANIWIGSITYSKPSFPFSFVRNNRFAFSSTISKTRYSRPPSRSHVLNSTNFLLNDHHIPRTWSSFWILRLNVTFSEPNFRKTDYSQMDVKMISSIFLSFLFGLNALTFPFFFVFSLAACLTSFYTVAPVRDNFNWSYGLLCARYIHTHKKTLYNWPTYVTSVKLCNSCAREESTSLWYRQDAVTGWGKNWFFHWFTQLSTIYPLFVWERRAKAISGWVSSLSRMQSVKCWQHILRLPFKEEPTDLNTTCGYCSFWYSINHRLYSCGDSNVFICVWELRWVPKFNLLARYRGVKNVHMGPWSPKKKHMKWVEKEMFFWEFKTS